MEDPRTQQEVILKSSRLQGVVGTRLFGPDGRFVWAFPLNVLEADLAGRHLENMKRLEPVSEFRPEARLSELFLPDPGEDFSESPFPLLEVNVPLHDSEGGELLGVAQFLIEGQGIAGDFARLDRELIWQASVAFLVGGGLLVGALSWAFARLRGSQRALARRTEDLLRANEELALAARTSAVGAVAAHLIHGLKNPLYGLREFVTARGGEADSDWQAAAESTGRMQSLINQIVSVLREEEQGVQYEVTLEELGELIRARGKPAAKEREIALELRVEGAAVLTNRTANLLALILMNLIHNALQASPAGGRVEVFLFQKEGRIDCDIRDEGPGLPEELKENPFVPCKSAKKGGSGIGLAISKQLANHLGAELVLRRTGPTGTHFALSVPVGEDIRKTRSASGAMSR
jgi:signal transduction histidine kinase